MGVVGLSGTSDHHCSAILMLFQCVGQTRKGPSLQILRKEFDSVVKVHQEEYFNNCDLTVSYIHAFGLFISKGGETTFKI